MSSAYVSISTQPRLVCADCAGLRRGNTGNVRIDVNVFVKCSYDCGGLGVVSAVRVVQSQVR